MKGIKKKKGFTLVELMAAMAIFIIFIGMIGSVFVQGYKILNRTNNYSAIEDEFRNAIMSIEKSVSEASVGEVEVKNQEISNEEKLLIDINGGEIQYIERKNGDGSNSLVEYKPYAGVIARVLIYNVEHGNEKFIIDVSESNGIINVEIPKISKGNIIRKSSYLASIASFENTDIDLEIGYDDSSGGDIDDDIFPSLSISKFVNVKGNANIGGSTYDNFDNIAYGGVISTSNWDNDKVIIQNPNEQLRNISLEMNNNNLYKFIDYINVIVESNNNNNEVDKEWIKNIQINKNVSNSRSAMIINAEDVSAGIVNIDNLENVDLTITGDLNFNEGNSKVISLKNSSLIIEGSLSSTSSVKINLDNSYINCKRYINISNGVEINLINKSIMNVGEYFKASAVTKFILVDSMLYICGYANVNQDVQMNLSDNSTINIGDNTSFVSVIIELKDTSNIYIDGKLDIGNSVSFNLNNNSSILISGEVTSPNNTISIDNYSDIFIEGKVYSSNKIDIILKNNCNINIQGGIESPNTTINLKDFADLYIGENITASNKIDIRLDNNCNGYAKKDLISPNIDIELNNTSNMITGEVYSNGGNHITLKSNNKSIIVICGKVKSSAVNINLYEGVAIATGEVSASSIKMDFTNSNFIIDGNIKAQNCAIGLKESSIIGLNDINLEWNHNFINYYKSFILVLGNLDVYGNLVVSDNSKDNIPNNDVVTKSINYFLTK